MGSVADMEDTITGSGAESIDIVSKNKYNDSKVVGSAEDYLDSSSSGVGLGDVGDNSEEDEEPPPQTKGHKRAPSKKRSRSSATGAKRGRKIDGSSVAFYKKLRRDDDDDDDRIKNPKKSQPQCTTKRYKSTPLSLIGCRIKVWWPKDKAFYEGVVESYDTLKKKHKVLYDDEEVEILRLDRERWEIIGEGTQPAKGAKKPLWGKAATGAKRGRKTGLPSGRDDDDDDDDGTKKPNKSQPQLKDYEAALTGAFRSEDKDFCLEAARNLAKQRENEILRLKRSLRGVQALIKRLEAETISAENEIFCPRVDWNHDVLAMENIQLKEEIIRLKSVYKKEVERMSQEMARLQNKEVCSPGETSSEEDLL